MGKYLFIASYTAAGAKGLMSDSGSGRRAVLVDLAASVGGSLESFYYAFGGDDAFVICELPSDEAAAALALTVGAGGAATVRTVVLLTPEQIDTAVGMSPSYSPPGS